MTEPERWTAYPQNSAHVYHTEKKGIARIWQERDGLKVEPELEPFEEGTVAHFLYND